MKDEQLILNCNEFQIQMNNYLMPIYSTIKRRKKVINNKEANFYENGIQISYCTYNNSRMDITISNETTPLSISFYIYDIEKEDKMTVREFEIRNGEEKLLIWNEDDFGATKDAIENNLNLRSPLERIFFHYYGFSSKSEVEKNDIINKISIVKDTLSRYKSNEEFDFEEFIMEVVKAKGIEVDDNELNVLFESFNNWKSKEKQFQKRVDNAVDKFQKRDPKDQLRRVNEYEQLLKDIKERIRSGTEVKKDYEEIYLDIAKTLNIKDLTMLFIFIEYCEQCVSQKNEISKRCDYLQQYKDSGKNLRKSRLNGVFNGVKNTISSVISGKDDGITK